MCYLYIKSILTFHLHNYISFTNFKFYFIIYIEVDHFYSFVYFIAIIGIINKKLFKFIVEIVVCKEVLV